MYGGITPPPNKLTRLLQADCSPPGGGKRTKIIHSRTSCSQGSLPLLSVLQFHVHVQWTNYSSLAYSESKMKSLKRLGHHGGSRMRCGTPNFVAVSALVAYLHQLDLPFSLQFARVFFFQTLLLCERSSAPLSTPDGASIFS